MNATSTTTATTPRKARRRHDAPPTTGTELAALHARLDGLAAITASLDTLTVEVRDIKAQLARSSSTTVNMAPATAPAPTPARPTTPARGLDEFGFPLPRPEHNTAPSRPAPAQAQTQAPTGPPTTGKQLFRLASDAGVLDDLIHFGQQSDFPDRIIAWTFHQVFIADRYLRGDDHDAPDMGPDDDRPY